MRIEHIREFIALSSSLSFSETSRRLFVTQSALSRHIAQMEDELGAKLLVRDSHHVRLTEVGRTFVEDAKLIAQSYDNALDHVAQVREGAKPILRIGYLYDAGRKYLPRVTHALAAHDDVSPRYWALEYGELEAKLAERKVDVAITIDFKNSIEFTGGGAESSPWRRPLLRRGAAPACPCAA